jgi:hypothetical protein
MLTSALLMSSLSAHAGVEFTGPTIVIDDPCDFTVDGEPNVGCEPTDPPGGDDPGGGGGSGGGSGSGTSGGGTGGGSTGDPGYGKPAFDPNDDTPEMNVPFKLGCFELDNTEGMTHRLVIYVQQPVEDDACIWCGNPKTMGHTFIGIEQDDGSGTPTRLILGAYPEQRVSSESSSSYLSHAPNEFHDDSGTDYDASITYDLSDLEFDDLITHLLGVYGSSVPFDIETNNDVDYARAAAASAGVHPNDIPDGLGMYNGISGSFYGQSSARFGQDLQGMSSGGGVVVDDDGGSTPEVAGCKAVLENQVRD